MKPEYCFICTEEIQIYAIGVCNHPICHQCNLRLRALYKNKSCSYCKVDQPDMIYSSQLLDYTTVLPAELQKRDVKLGIQFTNDKIYTETMHLLQFNCPYERCKTICGNGWEELKAHVHQSHGRQLCPICIQFKKVFSHEHELYTKQELSLHYNKGHPSCGFCMLHFYGKDELFEHCRGAHETCFLCKQKGITDVYYENYNYLEKHFESDHYLCKERECLEKKFVVFENDIDMRAHDTKEHASKVKKGKSVPIELNFQYAPRPSSSSSKGKKMSIHHDFPVSNLQTSSSSIGKNEVSISDRVPSHFGSNLSSSVESLSTIKVSMKQVTQEAPSETSLETSQQQEQVISIGGDPKLIESLQTLLDSNPIKFNEFKSLASSFKSRILSADEFLQGFISLCTLDKPDGMKKSIIGQVGKVWIRLSDSLISSSSQPSTTQPTTIPFNKKGKNPLISQQDEMVCAWNNYKARSANQVSAWDATVTTSSNSQWNNNTRENQSQGKSKILIIKPSSSSTPGMIKKRVPSLKPTTKSIIIPSNPLPVTSSQETYKTPWTSASCNPSQIVSKGQNSQQEAFPQLPTTSSYAVSNMLKGMSLEEKKKDWIQESIDSSLLDSSSSSGKKKKRGKTVLMHFG